MDAEYFTRTEPIHHGGNRWDYLTVSIFRRTADGEMKIGEYVRNYSAFYDTFFPFQQDGEWYALYSPDYTGTRVMALPSCRDLGGEERNSGGFCPVDYYVPYDHARVAAAGQGGRFGFVAGCIWGDDTSWKIQYLDLGEIKSGVLTRKELFGYLAMPEKARRLRECISLDAYDPPDSPGVVLTAEVGFSLENGKRLEIGDI